MAGYSRGDLVQSLVNAAEGEISAVERLRAQLEKGTPLNRQRLSSSSCPATGSRPAHAPASCPTTDAKQGRSELSDGCWTWSASESRFAGCTPRASDAQNSISVENVCPGCATMGRENSILYVRALGLRPQAAFRPSPHLTHRRRMS